MATLHIAGGNAKYYSFFEREAVSYKTKHTQRKTNKKIFIEENDTDSVSQLKGKIRNLERKLEARKKRRIRKCRKDFLDVSGGGNRH